MVAAFMALTSCNGSNNGEKLTTVIHLSASQDLLDVCDIEVTYKGKGGVDIVDTVKHHLQESALVIRNPDCGGNAILGHGSVVRQCTVVGESKSEIAISIFSPWSSISIPGGGSSI